MDNEEIKKITSPVIKKEKTSSWKIFKHNFKEALKREIPLLQHPSKLSKWLFLLVVFLSIGLPLFGAWGLIQLIEPFMNFFKQDFGIFAIDMFFIVLVVSFSFFALIGISKFLLASISNQKQNWKSLIMTASIVTLFLCGFVFIHAIMGAPNTEWKLFYGNNQVAEFHCSDSWGRLIEGNEINCEIKHKKISLQNISGNLIIKLHNGTTINKNLTFIAPENINHIDVNLSANSNNDLISLTTGFYPKFYSEDRENQREKDFLTYFFGLLFICLITIPQLVLKMFDGIKKD